ncbi:MAG: type IV toxin-antitoxin system AbiEi family antitoxin domain-containing protein [Rhodospirillaceae bacterium]
MLIAKRIARKRGDVFLRADFDDLGGYDQIGRSLRYLVKTGKLVKIGQGLYARATTSPFDERPIPVKGVSELMKEALGRVGVETMPTRMQRDYNAGRTTQVPTGRVIGVNKRVRRTIGYDGWTAKFERA